MNDKCCPRFLYGLLLLAPWLCGCNGTTGVVSGVVKIDGKPASGLEITLTPIGHESGTALGYSKEGGKFEVTRGRGYRDIGIGKYKVSVNGAATDDESEEAGNTLKIAKQFRSPDETPLIETVVAGQNMLEINVTSK